MISVPPVFAGNAALALLAAATWGGGDFAGGMGVKHTGGSLRAALHLVLLSHFLSLSALAATALLRDDPFPAGPALAWGLAAGLFGSTSVLAFYVCLARGAMGASAAISGLLAAAIPSAVSVLLEGAPGGLRLVGFLIAAVAIWLVAGSPDGSAAPRSTVALSILSGTGFGLYFVALRMAGSAGVLWPLALSRSVSISVCLLGLAAVVLGGARGSATGTKPPVFFDMRFVAWAVATALLDTAGNLFFLEATRAGRLDVASVLASLYPASTILLAAWLLRERPRARQGLGMALAVAAVVLITL